MCDITFIFLQQNAGIERKCNVTVTLTYYSLTLKDNCTNFTFKSLSTSFGEHHYTCEKVIQSPVRFGSNRSCVESDKLPYVMTPDSSLVGSENYKSENDKTLGVWS